MLRLWPERWYVGLLGPHAWLAPRASGQPLPLAPTLPSGATPAQLLDALLHAAPPRRRPGKLSAMLPSQAMRCVAVPWSADVRSSEEQRAYALAHFEQAGLAAGDGDAVHVEFRHFGAQGLAYAVPRRLLDELQSVAASHAMTLTTVLPISAVAHLSARRASAETATLTLVIEPETVSALVLDRTGLKRYDAEPCFGGSHAALRRLLTRLHDVSEHCQDISLCADGAHDELAGIVGGVAAQATVRGLTPSQWRNYL